MGADPTHLSGLPFAVLVHQVLLQEPSAMVQNIEFAITYHNSVTVVVTDANISLHLLFGLLCTLAICCIILFNI